MNFDLTKRLEHLFEEWLLENYPGEIHNEEDLNKAVSMVQHGKEFVLEVKGVLE